MMTKKVELSQGVLLMKNNIYIKVMCNFFNIFILLCGCFFCAQSKAVCTSSLNDVQQTIFTYIYLIRYNSPADLLDYTGSDSLGSKMLRKLNSSLNIMKSDIGNELLFNNKIYVLQGRGVTATVELNKKSTPIQPESSAFILSDAPDFEGKIILILSSWGPVKIQILSFDKCFNVRDSFDSMNYLTSAERKKHQDSYYFYKPLEKITVTKNEVRLYEYNKKSYYSIKSLLNLSKGK